MLRLIPAAAAVLLLATVLRAEDCPNCADGKLCLSHEAIDDIAVKDADIKLKTKDMMGKREAVNGLADAQLKHMNVRSKKITMALVKALADPEENVKLLAAEKIATLGEPSVAAQGLASQVAWYKKQIGNNRPKKAVDQPVWDGHVKMLKLMYESLATVKDPSVVKTFVEDIGSSSPWVAKSAAECTAPFKENKEIVKALMDGMKKWIGPSQQPARPEGTLEAFFACSQGLEKIVPDPPKDLNGKTQPECLSRWDSWWKANEAKYK
ncbi:MAG: hypothetical protein IT452_09700 [Planctomycetia bacterium]|nr:hypothetical protein [Planctomycetia bacterium]